MEIQGTGGLLPPKLEDAGLEDCALPIEGIQEAFRIAADKAKSAADTLRVNVLSKHEDAEGCISNPTPVSGDLQDTPIATAGTTPGDSCVDVHTGGLLEDGKDAVVDPLGDAKEDKLIGVIGVEPKLGEGGCLKGGDLLEPLGVPDASDVADSGGDEEPKGPGLTEGLL